MSLFSSNDENFCTPFGRHNGTRRFIDNLDQNKLEPENEIGNVEYKLRLINPSPARIERLVSQLKWRIREGQGEAIVVIGVQDNGNLVGLTPDEVRLSMETLQCMADKIGASLTIVRERIVEDRKEHRCPKARNLERQRLYNENSSIITNKNNRNNSTGNKSNQNTIGHSNSNNNKSSNTNNNRSTIADNNRTNLRQSTLNSKAASPSRKVLEVLVRKKTHDIPNELRAAVLGPTDSGKSSLLGVLSHSEHDNGRGSARLNLFRHRHEIKSGHTSSISQEILGFDQSGQPITYNQCLTAEEIVESADKIVTLIDLAGHQRYLGTTLFGLGSNSPDIVLLVVSAVSQVSLVTEELISLALGIGQSLIIIINKIDLASKDEQDQCCDALIRLLSRTSNMTLMRVMDVEDAACVSSRMRNDPITPIFFTSCVTGAGINLLYEFFNRLTPTLSSTDLELALNLPSELQIDETFMIPGTGVVVSGLLVNGVVREGDKMLLGPDDRGSLELVSILSLQRHKVPCESVRAGQCCTLAIKSETQTVNLEARKGMILREFDPNWLLTFPICFYFRAQIRLIGNYQQKLAAGGQVSIYVGNVKQTCDIVSVSEETIGSGSESPLYSVLFKFIKRPEYVKPRSKLMFRHAFLKGIGIVLEVYKNKPNY